MIDLEIRCVCCDRTPATLRLNGATVCRSCALVLINRASPPARPVRRPMPPIDRPALPVCPFPFESGDVAVPLDGTASIGTKAC